MRKAGKALIVAALIGTMAFVLAACGGTSTASSGAASSAAESSAAASAATASSETPSEVFAVLSTVHYQEDGSVLSTTTNELDEHGNAVTTTSIRGDNENMVKYEYDENGCTTKLTQPDGQEVTYETALDGDKPLKVVGSNGAVTEYKYHDNGTLSETNSTFNDEFTNTTSYDENGYETRKSATFKSENSEKEGIVEYSWEFDGSGNPVSLTVTETKADDGVSIGALVSGKYTIECDANGNIVKIANAESGNTVLEYEYVKVDDPSTVCKLSYAIKSI